MTKATVPAGPPASAMAAPSTRLIWANLLHVGYNLYHDRDEPLSDQLPNGPDMAYRPYLRCDTSLWRDLLKRMPDAGLNMVVIDLADAVRYETHPEIAVKRAWSVDRLRREVARARRAGLEPIPKLNFSTSHDIWLGPYSRCVSTPAYYEVCRDLIGEVTDIFGQPRFFHIGMDEEMALHQKRLRYVCYRQYDLWWHDLYFLIDQVEKAGSRAWMWADAMSDTEVWSPGPAFLAKMPKSVVQSNWTYGNTYPDGPADAGTKLGAYFTLAEHGYDQIPCGSSYYFAENFEMLTAYITRHVDPSHLLGFLHTTWVPTRERYRRRHLDALEQVKRAVQRRQGASG